MNINRIERNPVYPRGLPEVRGVPCTNLPLDPEMLERSYLSGESVCHYLRLHAKSVLWGQKQVGIPEVLNIRVALVYPKLIARYISLKKALERAATRPPKTPPPIL